jgi:hypothetical protein
MNVFRHSIPFLMATVFGTGVIAVSGVALPQTANGQTQVDPPARVGRLAFADGAVSFHDAQDANWTAASVNDALTTGDSLWTQPNARGEVSVSGTRVRLDQSTQLDMLKIDDSATRLQLDQGRLDIKTFSVDTSQPYEIVTPRGTVKLEAQGDYYVESGSTQDPTRLGVRSGAAQITGLNGQVLAVRAGEVGEITGDAQSPQLQTIQSAPPPVPQYWAQRDQQITYADPQYLSADVVGYEDMQAYGGWSNDPDYGQVWSPNTVPDGWQPYSTGAWAYSDPYGWTWVDEQPWGFAPYHYGRWANRNNRWFWVPPEHGQHAVYAPALVAFIGGAELGVAIGNAGASPVGWFPLGPREAYVPPYTNNRAYYDRINTDAHVDKAVMNDRWQRAESHQAITANDPNEHMANRRFTTVVPAQAFVSSQPVERAAIKVSADKLASAPISAVSAPPAPATGNTPKADTRFNGAQQIGRPTPAQRTATPGPKVAERTAPPAAAGRTATPPLEPRQGAAPPAIQGEHPQAQQPNAAQPNRPAEANRAEPPKPGQPATPQAQQANRPEPPKPGEAHPPAPQAHQAEAPHAPAPQAAHAEPQHEAPRAAEPPAAPPPQRAVERAPPLVHPQSEPPRPQAPHPAAEIARPAAAPPAQVAHAPAPPPQAPHPAAPAPHPAAPPEKK